MFMNVRVLASTLVAVGALLPAVTWAGDWYVGLHGGANLLNDANVDIDNSGNLSAEAGFDDGYALGISVGRYFYYPKKSWTVRGELSIDYRENDVDEFSVGIPGMGSGTTHDVDGSQSSFSGLANMWFDYDAEGAVAPYFGGGLGIASVANNDVEVEGVDFADDSTAVFAYQFGAGLIFDVGENVALSVDYRYFATEDAELTADGGRDYEIENDNHSIMLGLRYKFSDSSR